MTNEKKLELLAEMMDVDAKDLTGDTVLADIEEWDSVSAISFVAMLDDEFGKTISAGDLKRCKTVADLMEQMEE
jgi:acyl carrier protein